MRGLERSGTTWVWAVLVVASGCATSPPGLVVPRLPVEIREPAVVETAQGSPCGEPIPGWRAFARPGRVVVLGEKHGSNEIPAFVGDAVCQAAVAGLGVQVALEIPRVEQPLLDAYLVSAGTEEDQRRLMRGEMWHRIYEDGRSSTAIVQLIERLRAIRQSGRSVGVHYYDSLLPPGTPKEEQLATHVAQISGAHPRDLVVVLTGNTHARTVVGVAWDEAFQPMGYHLAQHLPDLLVLDAQYAGGEAWFCELSRWGKRVKCGARSAGAPLRTFREEDLPRLGDGKLARRFAGTFPAPSVEGYHGIFYVGALTPAVPAMEQLAIR